MPSTYAHNWHRTGYVGNKLSAPIVRCLKCGDHKGAGLMSDCAVQNGKVLRPGNDGARTSPAGRKPKTLTACETGQHRREMRERAREVYVTGIRDNHKIAAKIGVSWRVVAGLLAS